MGTSLTIAKEDLSIKELIEKSSGGYDDKSAQEDLENVLLRVKNERVIRFILGRLNPNFCLKTILNFLVDQNCSVVTAGIAFNQLSKIEKYSVKLMAYQKVTQLTPHKEIGRNAERYWEQLTKNVIIFPIQIARRRKVRRAPGSWVEIIHFPKR